MLYILCLRTRLNLMTKKTQDIDKYEVFLGDSFVSNDSNTGTECLCHWHVLSG